MKLVLFAAEKLSHPINNSTTLYSCHGFFTDRSILSLNLSRIQALTNDDMSTCSGKAALFFSLPKRAHVHWNWPILRKKYPN